MRFSVWLEAIEGAAGIVHRISQVIDSSPDYDSAVEALKGLGVDIGSGAYDTYFGTEWSEALYDFMANPNERKPDPGMDEEIKRQAEAIKKIPGLTLAPYNRENLWHYFSVEAPDGDSDIGSKVKIHAKVPEDDLGMLSRIARAVSDNRSYFEAFKFSYDSASMTKRRDNFVAYLTSWGRNNQDRVAEVIKSAGAEVDFGEDLTVDRHGGGREDVSQTQRMAYRLAAMMVSKKGAPLKGAYGPWKMQGQAIEKVDPIVAHYTRMARGGSGGSSGSLVMGSISGGSRPMTFNINAQVGRSFLSMQLRGDDSLRFWGDPQFSVEKAGGGWYIVPVSGTVNATMVNNEPLSARRRLSVGDTVSIHSKLGKRVTPLRVLSA